MTSLSRILFFFTASAAALACSSSSSPAPTGNSHDEVVAGSAETCSSEGPIYFHCAACPSGYKVENGKPTCECCDDPGTPSEGGGPQPVPCCDPAAKPAPQSPEGVFCCADGTWQHSIGSGVQSTCQGNGGAGDICTAGDAEGDETCSSEGPIWAYCAACPSGYKVENGQPTCECCGE